MATRVSTNGRERSRLSACWRWVSSSSVALTRAVASPSAALVRLTESKVFAAGQVPVWAASSSTCAERLTVVLRSQASVLTRSRSPRQGASVIAVVRSRDSRRPAAERSPAASRRLRLSPDPCGERTAWASAAAITTRGMWSMSTAIRWWVSSPGSITR